MTAKMTFSQRSQISLMWIKVSLIWSRAGTQMQKTLMLMARRMRKQSHLSLVPLARTTMRRLTRLMMI